VKGRSLEIEARTERTIEDLRSEIARRDSADRGKEALIRGRTLEEKEGIHLE